MSANAMILSAIVVVMLAGFGAVLLSTEKPRRLGPDAPKPRRRAF
jgi:hypothetical protein